MIFCEVCKGAVQRFWLVGISATGFALALLTCQTALAQPGSDPVFSAIDVDRDGRVSANELSNAPEAIRRLDKNRDGMISGEEGGAAKQGGGGSRLGGYRTPPPANDVPDHLCNVILGRLTDRSAVARVLFHQDVEAYIGYGVKRGEYADRTESATCQQGVPFDFLIAGLKPDTRYYYRLCFRKANGKVDKTNEATFHTQRAPGRSFVFTVQADSHLDENTSGDVYLRTLANALSDRPDFHFAIGDTFMTGKYVRPELSLPQYLAQRYYLGHLCHSAGLFFALGNHDGESGNRGSNVWATATRKRFLPNPYPDGFYTGNDKKEPEVGLPENYYQFHWGDAQFIVLDPFRYTTVRERGSDNWNFTLGEEQYRWLEKSLEQSQAKFKFVFLHHLVGGADRNSRGGIEAAPFWEWGGKGSTGEFEFDRMRPGWDKPIHPLLVDHGASIVFHGHDHMFIKQDLDGIVYQLVPQPGHPRFGNTRSAPGYGYLAGEMQSSSGHVRVKVDGDSVRVDYVRAFLPKSETASRKNGEISYSYMLSPASKKVISK